MTNKTARVLLGFINLNSSERNEFIDELNAYLRETTQKKSMIEKSVQNIVSGPLGTPCVCCGK